MLPVQYARLTSFRFKVVTFVMDTTIEQTFSTNPYRHNLDLDSINRAREKRAVAKTASRGLLGTAEGLSMQYMRQTVRVPRL